jgi:hypothetical protein
MAVTPVCPNESSVQWTVHWLTRPFWRMVISVAGVAGGIWTWGELMILASMILFKTDSISLLLIYVKPISKWRRGKDKFWGNPVVTQPLSFLPELFSVLSNKTFQIPQGVILWSHHPFTVPLHSCWNHLYCKLQRHFATELRQLRPSIKYTQFGNTLFILRYGLYSMFVQSTILTVVLCVWNLVALWYNNVD